MSDARRPLAILSPLLAPLALFLWGWAAGDYWRFVLTLVATSTVIGAALTMLVGFARCISLATGAMMGIGAYCSTLLILHAGLPFPVAVVASALAGGVGGLLLAIPAVRFKSHNLAMVTLVFQAVVIILVREMKSVTGGAEGLNVAPPVIFGQTISSDLVYLGMAACFCALALLPISVLLSGPYGRNLRALATNEVAARAFGIRIERYLMAAFTVSSAAIAMAGALAAPRFRIIDPDSFGLHTSIVMLAYPVIGGMTSIWGGILGGGLMRLLPELLRPIADYIELILAAIVILTVMFFRGGLTEIGERLCPRRTAPLAAAPDAPAERATTLPAPRPPSHAHAGDALVATNIVKRYGALAAVDDVTLAIRAGTLHGIMGPNGAGKTTFFNAVTGFIAPDAGRVVLFGQEAKPGRVEDRIALGITRTFQHVAIFPGLTCRDNVIAGLGRNGVRQSFRRSLDRALWSAAARDEHEAASWALAAVGLRSLAETRADQLSLGNQRRLEIARAIVSRPRLILLDEPVSGVSHGEVEQIVTLLRRLNVELGATMLIVEHNIGFLTALCDRISVMASGRIIADGLPAEVVARKEVRQVYFGEIEDAA
ncbi:MAG: Branched-chain amino acid transport system permease protein [Enterovirga sp.]|nr:Branched-chain amino acid transport system permease protein [Enterovirga sp.]